MLKNLIAKKVPHRLQGLDEVRVDHYYWLNDRDNEEVISYLEAENSYRESIMSGTEALQEKLYQEMTGRLKKDDQFGSLPPWRDITTTRDLRKAESIPSIAVKKEAWKRKKRLC